MIPQRVQTMSGASVGSESGILSLFRETAHALILVREGTERADEIWPSPISFSDGVICHACGGHLVNPKTGETAGTDDK
jgi:hypothetical protein